MPIFPPARCPDCGTEGLTGRICPMCKFTLWHQVLHFLDPSGMESIVFVEEGYRYSFRSLKRARVVKAMKTDEDTTEEVDGFAGNFVTPIDGGEGWISFDQSEWQIFHHLPPANGPRVNEAGQEPNIQGVPRDFKPANAFPKKVAERLRQAVRPDRPTKRVRKILVNGTPFYSYSDAKQWWSKEIEAFEEKERKR